jgi:hypothetical protein
MVLSNGELLDMPRLLTSGERQRLLGLQRKAARQQLARTPGTRLSIRHRRTLDQIARLRAKTDAVAVRVECLDPLAVSPAAEKASIDAYATSSVRGLLEK